MLKFKKSEEELNSVHVLRIKAGNARIVKPDPPHWLFFPPNKIKRNYRKKIKNKNKTAPRIEECSHQDPESGVETKIECDANKNETNACYIKWDK